MSGFPEIAFLCYKLLQLADRKFYSNRDRLSWQDGEKVMYEVGHLDRVVIFIGGGGVGVKVICRLQKA